MIEKLNMTEEQVEMLTEIRDGQRQKRRELRKNNRDAMDAVMKKANPDFTGFGFPRQSREQRTGTAGTMAATTAGGQNGNQRQSTAV